MAENNSSVAQSLVRLQRPFPVIYSFFPNFSFFSKRWTSCPPLAACTAAIIPAAPPPTIKNFAMFRIPFSIFSHIPAIIPEGQLQFQ